MEDILLAILSGAIGGAIVQEILDLFKILVFADLLYHMS